MGAVRQLHEPIDLTREERIALHNFTAAIGPQNPCGLRQVDMDAMRFIERVQRAINVKEFGGTVTAETRGISADVSFAEGDLRWLLDRFNGCGAWQGGLASVIVPIVDKLGDALNALRTGRTNGDAPQEHPA